MLMAEPPRRHDSPAIDDRLVGATPRIGFAAAASTRRDSIAAQTQEPDSETGLIHPSKGVMNATLVSRRGTAGSPPVSADPSGRRWWGGERVCDPPCRRPTVRRPRREVYARG